jgi:phasin family protein
MADTETVTPKAETAVRKFEKVAEKATTQTAAQVNEKIEQIATKVEETTQAATTGLKDVQAKVTNGLHKAAEVARGVVDVQRGALETAVKASQIYGEGLQGMATRAADVSRTQFEDTMAHLRSLTSVKSVKQAVELQTAFTRNTLSRVLNETSVFVEDYLKVAGQALAPVTARAREAADKVKSTTEA